MITLEAAVAELEAMEDPMEVLKRYPNDPKKFVGGPCRSCPVATYLKERTGRPVWVSPDEARPNMTDPANIEFSNKLKAVIAELDLDRHNARHAT